MSATPHTATHTGYTLDLIAGEILVVGPEETRESFPPSVFLGLLDKPAELLAHHLDFLEDDIRNLKAFWTPFFTPI